MESIREFSYLEEGSLEWDQPRPKANNKNIILNCIQKSEQ